MRIEFVDVKYYYQAKKLCPWASKIAKVFGGFKCFESIDDYLIWNNQK